ncbi:helix-turn-helix domain-containing protein [Mucilaginibacter sp. UR6-1]|uniref:helix-turn-helix domain-containing protein n=1 Tax=Mucilaginibacter sp. UR6-1 TaxID=1435643 RepID=UPI001E65529F|nr:helix-turn-helix domain-containing protein [Mucilaginibacter sp. UR6-1]MCC8409459.1 helix-turn-helix domain-containing protein [Mucilaginibacter sp. UR6-1]
MEQAIKTEHITKSYGFNASCSDETDSVVRTYSRKDFYKVCLYRGKCIIEYADRGIELDGLTLFFGTPHIPYSWEDIEKEKAYSALFTEEFLKTNNNSESLQQSPLFKIGGTPIFKLNEEQGKSITDIFEKIITAYHTDYIYKSDLIRSHINLIIHEALQMEPSASYTKHKNASSRVTALFLELLERQFPIESPQNPLKLRNAADFAGSLAIHVNHLNRSVKEVTGRPTTAHIAERIITEAKALLKHTNWSTAEIAFSLGFEYPTYFNNYFKKLTATTPTAFRG